MEVSHADRGVAALLSSLGSTHADGSSWTHAASNAAMRLTVSSAVIPGVSAKAFRGEILLPYSCSTIVACTLSLDERCSWDRGIARLASHIVHEPHYRVFYSATKPAGGGIISGRDFTDAVFVGPAAELPPTVTAAAARPIADGAYVSAGVGLREHPSFPITPELVRGFNRPSGWLLEPAEPLPPHEVDSHGRPPPDNSNGWCKVTYIVQPELSGWLPSSVVNASLSSMFGHFFGDMLAFLQTVAREDLEKEAS